MTRLQFAKAHILFVVVYLLVAMAFAVSAIGCAIVLHNTGGTIMYATLVGLLLFFIETEYQTAKVDAARGQKND